MEVVAIISCVAAVVSAFKDGAFIVQQIKEKRRARKALPPTTLLEESLKKGSQAVEEAKDDGIQKFGSEFAIGDKIATDALKDVLIELQGSLIKHLRKASENDSMTDFTILIDASDFGRIKAVSILSDLYLRKTNAAPIPRIAPQLLRSVPPSLDYRNSPDQADGKASHHEFGQSVGNQYGFDGTTTRSKTGVLPTHPSQLAPSHQDTKPLENSARSPKANFWRFRSKSTAAIELQEGKRGHQNYGSNRSMSPHDSVPRGNRSSALTMSSHIPADEDNPWAKELSSSPKATHKASLEERPNPEAKLHKNLRRPSTNDSKYSTHDLYGGFCKGAYKLQVGLSKDGIKLRNASGSFQGEGYYWACGSSKCAFEGRSCKVNKEWAFDDSIRVYHGVRYRWVFLAKSHVMLAKVKDRIYDYRCVFCVYQGQEAPVFRGAKVLMQHISQHRGEDLDEAILQKTKCISMREAADEEDFDINLTPADTEIGLRQAVESQLTYDSRGTWLASEDTISDTNHWRI